MEVDLKNVHCVAVDADPYHLHIARAHSKFPILPENAPRGNSESGEDSECHVSEEVSHLLGDADIVFVLAGMGGVTGSAVAPIVAETARKAGALTIGLVTQPFHFERARFNTAIDGMRKMLNACDTVILIDNHMLEPSTLTLPFRFDKDTPSQTCCSIIESIAHTFSNSGLSNADLGEFRMMLRRGGLAKAGVGHSYSNLGTEEATLRALRNAMALGGLTQANGIFLNIVGCNRVEHRHLVSTLDIVSRKIDPNAQLLYGHRIDPAMQGVTRVTLLATGMVFPYTWGGYRNIPLGIYDLEPDALAEKKLSLELELHQLESYAD